MADAIAVAEPSTATIPAPQVAPEVAPQIPSVEKPASKPSAEERIQEILKKNRENKGKSESQPIKDETAQAEPIVGTTEEGAILDDSPLEVVSHNGKEVPIADVLKDATFEVFANGEYKNVDGIEKLMDMASIGFAAVKKNETAKQVIQKSQELIKEIELSKLADVQKGVADYLNNLLDQVTNGKSNPATGQPFQSQVERQRAVALANELITTNSNGAKSNQPMTREEILKLVEEAGSKKVQQSETQKAEQQRQQQMAEITKNAESSLQKVTAPLMQYFTGEDGKTLNKRLYGSFQEDVKKEADNLYKAFKGVPNQAQIQDFITKASKVVLDDYKPSLKASKVSEAVKTPATSRGSGMIATNQPKKTFSSPEAMIAAKIKQLRSNRQ